MEPRRPTPPELAEHVEAATKAAKAASDFYKIWFAVCVLYGLALVAAVAKAIPG